MPRRLNARAAHLQTQHLGIDLKVRSMRIQFFVGAIGIVGTVVCAIAAIFVANQFEITVVFSFFCRS